MISQRFAISLETRISGSGQTTVDLQCTGDRFSLSGDVSAINIFPVDEFIMRERNQSNFEGIHVPLPNRVSVRACERARLGGSVSAFVYARLFACAWPPPEQPEIVPRLLTNSENAIRAITLYPN